MRGKKNSYLNRVTIFGILGLFFLIFAYIIFLRNTPKETQRVNPVPVSPAVSLSPSPSSSAEANSVERSIITPLQGEYVKVERVIDGDTIKIEGGKTVRYIGIDAPESVDPRRKNECFGKEASLQNVKLVEGQTVRLVRDVSETDKYGRLLRYVFLGDIFINEYLVKEGYAHVSTFPPDVMFKDVFIQAEQHARTQHLGLWGSVCDF